MLESMFHRGQCATTGSERSFGRALRAPPAVTAYKRDYLSLATTHTRLLGAGSGRERERGRERESDSNNEHEQRKQRRPIDPRLPSLALIARFLPLVANHRAGPASPERPGLFEDSATKVLIAKPAASGRAQMSTRSGLSQSLTLIIKCPLSLGAPPRWVLEGARAPSHSCSHVSHGRVGELARGRARLETRAQSWLCSRSTSWSHSDVVVVVLLLLVLLLLSPIFVTHEWAWQLAHTLNDLVVRAPRRRLTKERSL